MEKSKFCLLGAGLSLMLTGCATTMDGSSQTMTFESDPPGAALMGDSGVMGVTPVTLDVKRRDTGVFTFEKSGYKPTLIQAKKKVNKTSYANILLLPLWPIAHLVDEVSGGRYAFIDEEIHVDLEPMDEDA